MRERRPLMWLETGQAGDFAAANVQFLTICRTRSALVAGVVRPGFAP